MRRQQEQALRHRRTSTPPSSTVHSPSPTVASQLQRRPTIRTSGCTDRRFGGCRRWTVHRRLSSRLSAGRGYPDAAGAGSAAGRDDSDAKAGGKAAGGQRARFAVRHLVGRRAIRRSSRSPKSSGTAVSTWGWTARRATARRSISASASTPVARREINILTLNLDYKRQTVEHACHGRPPVL